jgi:hypothetical protein
MWWLIAHGGGERRRTAIVRCVALTAVWLMFASPAAAQTEPDNADQETVRRLIERVEADSVTTAFYTQVSRQFGDSRPCFRYQYINASADDPAFRALGRRNGPTLGLRYDVGKFAAVKAQYERLTRRTMPTVNSLAGQLAFTF